jgi:hypothetical protein
MKNGLTCSLVIWPKLCITFSCSNRQNATLVNTQQRLTITFVLSNNLHNINSICKVVHQVMVLIRMNYCWGRLEGWVILLDLLQEWQITCPDCPLQITCCTLREKRFGSSKRPINCPPNVDNDSHCLDYVSLSCPWVTIFVVEPNIVDDVHMP